MLANLINTLRPPNFIRTMAGLSVRELEKSEHKEWEKLVSTHPFGRTVYPMYFLAAHWTEMPIGLFENGRLIGGLLAATRTLGAWPFAVSRILAVMVDRDRTRDKLERLLAGLEDSCKAHGIIETEVQLRLPANDAAEGYEIWRDISDVFAEHGYRRLPRVERSYFIRIDKSDDALLASFGQQPRNRIRKSFKEGSELFSSQDPALLELFYESYAGTADRKNMSCVLDRVQVVDGMKPLLESGRAIIFGEKYGEAISNMIIVDPQGTPCAMLASRTKANVAGELNSCAQAVHFHAMRTMRDRGHRWYDFGGCEGRVPIESHPNYGVWRFKHAFKGEYVTFLPHLRKIRGELTHSIMTLLHSQRGDPVCLF
jgi:hypothetical protein